MEALNITNLTANVNNIQGLSDRPNTADGLTPQQLKEKFDKAGADIKLYINGVQNTEIENYINNTLKTAIETIQSSYVSNSDSRLSNSRRCNNNFDDYLAARGNLKISYGTSLPSSGSDGDIFFLY